MHLLIFCFCVLVLCPNHLAKQWSDEIAKHAPSLRALSITTIIEHRALTMQSLLDAGKWLLFVSLFFVVVFFVEFFFFVELHLHLRSVTIIEHTRSPCSRSSMRLWY